MLYYKLERGTRYTFSDHPIVNVAASDICGLSGVIQYSTRS